MEFTIYEKIRERRKEMGLSQDELARRMGYKSRSTINKIESGQVDLSRNKIDKFSKVLNVSPSYLMGWTDEDENEKQKQIMQDHQNWLASILSELEMDESFDDKDTIIKPYSKREPSLRSLHKSAKIRLANFADQLHEIVTPYTSAPYASAPPSEQPQISPLTVVKRSLSNPFKVADNGFAPRISQGDLVHISTEKDLLPDKSVVAIQAVSSDGATPIQDNVVLRYFRYQLDYSLGKTVGVIFYATASEHPEIYYSLSWLNENPWAIIGAVEKVEFTLP